MKQSNENLRGMSLVELTLVLAVLLVVFGAVFTFFTRSTEAVTFSRYQNRMITEGRMALDRVTNEILWAGYMPGGGWSNANWHPVVTADNGECEFYADYGGNGLLETTDYREVTLEDEMFRISDRAGNTHYTGEDITTLDFSYLDEAGAVLTEPLDSLSRDEVRHFRISIDMTHAWGDIVHQVVLNTTISPRNLGINHNIDPSFFPPDPLEGTIVFNVGGSGVDGGTHTPTDDELLLINRMLFWGLTVILLNDDEMSTYDYVGEQIDLVILRYREAAATPNIYPNGDNFPVPVVTLNARDAMDIWSMGTDIDNLNNGYLTAANDWHPVNKGLPLPDSTYAVYRPGPGKQSVLHGMDMSAPMDTVVTYFSSTDSLDPWSGVYVIDEDSLSQRRILYSCYDASEYNELGWKLFRNVIEWNVGQPPPQVPLFEEGFENPDDYNDVEPGYGEDMWAYITSDSVALPAMTDLMGPSRLDWVHCYWTRNRKCGGYLEISTDSVTWTQVPDSLFMCYSYDAASHPDFPGGANVRIWCDKSPGYSPVSPFMTPERVDLEQWAGMTVWFRWVFAVNDKESNNQDGYIADDFWVWSIDQVNGDTVQVDTWPIYPRNWPHHPYPGFNDDWWYNDVHSIDPIFPIQIGYAWTTWGEIGYIGPWSHGGSIDSLDSWEIGTTAFYVPPDPAPTSQCGAHYSGNDLTLEDGLYNNLEWSWLLSEAYGGLDSTYIFEDIFLKIYRCIRLEPNDFARIFVAFTPDSTPPSCTDLSKWVEVRKYIGEYQDYWEWEIIEISDQFDSARTHPDSLRYYHLMFLLDSGPSTVEGGWNIDNISVVGEYF